MPKSMNNPILTILRAYERDPDLNGKKAVLLTPQGGYFLYGNRFCSIADYELVFQSTTSQIQGKSVEYTLFFGEIQGVFHAVSDKIGTLEQLSLIFHIDLGEDDLLRGVLLAAGQEAQFALFCDEAVEKLYRLAYRIRAKPGISVPPDEGLRQYVEALRQKDLRGLTGLYLRSRGLEPDFAEVYENCYCNHT